MSRRRNFEAVEVDRDTLYNVWNSLDLGTKVRNGLITIEVQPRYLARPLTQIIKVILPNGWVIGIAHRWRNQPTDEWSLPDPKRMWLDEVAIYYR